MFWAVIGVIILIWLVDLRIKWIRYKSENKPKEKRRTQGNPLGKEGQGYKVKLRRRRNRTNLFIGRSGGNAPGEKRKKKKK